MSISQDNVSDHPHSFSRLYSELLQTLAELQSHTDVIIVRQVIVENIGLVASLHDSRTTGLAVRSYMISKIPSDP